MKVNYGFTVINDDAPEEVLHIVGFANPPTERDWNTILEGLSNDPEWEHLQTYRWTMRYSTDTEIRFIREQMELQANGNRNPNIGINIQEKQGFERNPNTKH